VRVLASAANANRLIRQKMRQHQFARGGHDPEKLQLLLMNKIMGQVIAARLDRRET